MPHWLLSEWIYLRQLYYPCDYERMFLMYYSFNMCLMLSGLFYKLYLVALRAMWQNIVRMFHLLE
jgi:hypothetical protein